MYIHICMYGRSITTTHQKHIHPVKINSMATKWQHHQEIRDRRAREIGPDLMRSGQRAALAYPSPYRAGMSSLGYQWILNLLRQEGIAAERCFLPEDVEDPLLRSLMSAFEWIGEERSVANRWQLPEFPGEHEVDATERSPGTVRATGVRMPSAHTP